MTTPWHSMGARWIVKPRGWGVGGAATHPWGHAHLQVWCMLGHPTPMQPRWGLDRTTPTAQKVWRVPKWTPKPWGEDGGAFGASPNTQRLLAWGAMGGVAPMPMPSPSGLQWPSPPPREVPKDTSATSPWRGHAFKGLWRTSQRLGITPRFSQGLHQLGLGITQPFLVQIDQNLGR